MEWMSKLGEERDYKDEYKKFQSSTKSKKYRAELNKYNRKKGTYGNGDGKDASHKRGKIVGFESESKNRGRAEKSRLKKEGALNENPAAIAAATAMTKIKMNNPKTGKKISAVTALRDKDNPNHKKAKSIFQRLKDKLSKKKKEEPKKLSADSPEGKKAAAAAGVSVGSFTRESVNEAENKIADIRTILKTKKGKRIDSIFMDVETAEKVMKHYKSLGSGAKERLAKQKIQNIVKAVKKESVNEVKSKTMKTIGSIIGKKQAQKISGVLVDMQTALVIMKVWNALGTSNRAKFEKLPIKKMANVAWKLMK